jgi:hypothetical protein
VHRHYPVRVAPFGNLRIKVCLPLPEAYRSLPRPSSPAGTKASIVCPYTLDQKIFFGRLLHHASMVGRNSRRLPVKTVKDSRYTGMLKSCLPVTMQLSKNKSLQYGVRSTDYGITALCTPGSTLEWWVCLKSNQIPSRSPIGTLSSLPSYSPNA